MIIGLGMDLTEIPRIERLVERWGDRFLAKVFTPGEREFCMAKANFARHLAARFAAKEATLKALRVPPGLSWQEMEVIGGGQRCPELCLSGRAREAASDIGAQHLLLTLTHTNEIAAAVVVASSAPQ